MSEEVTDEVVGCLCWFWDINVKHKHLGILKKIEKWQKITFAYSDGLHWYQHCKHVDKEEIEFYQDKADDSCIGKLCKFWDDEKYVKVVGVLKEIDLENDFPYKSDNDDCSKYCRALTKKEALNLIKE